MKKLLLSLFLIPSLCSFKKDKKERPEPAFEKRRITAITAYGLPGAWWKEPTKDHAVTRGCIVVGAEYQVARWFKTGIQYSYFTAGTGMQPVQNYFSHTPYQRDRWFRENALLAIADLSYLNRGILSISSGIGLGISHANSFEYVIDSAGISTRTRTRSSTLGILGIRLVTAKVKITKDLGAFGGVDVGPGAQFAIGAHYTFGMHK